MEFAVGSVARVLGPEFAPVDGYRVRVRLPDEPLMLVDRILTVRGKKASLTSGTVVTEHDVHPDAWYLDGGRAPVCISVEAGQADLFLCAYLGIDLAVRGQRAYRLLDAEVTFHRGLPRPGETIRYEIHIDRFVRQGDTWLFFFRFDGTIGDRPLISMRRGCAGFFTADEIEASGGIVTTEEEKQPTAGRRPPDWKMPAPFSEPAACDDNQLAALRRGNLGRAFGSAFSGKRLSPSLRLPGGRMKLIDRILEMDPRGGRYGLGRIRGEADIHPDDWFLTCHFVDDRVMPGTLMYECCAHTLRVFLQRMGWISSAGSACYEPITGIRSRLKCRGPVTPETRRVIYEVEIKELGYGPEPYALADAHMIADDCYIVRFEDMSIKMTGVTRAEVETHWRAAVQVVCDRRQIEEYARGLPSRCFGAAYRVFDKERFLARLPSPPFLFVDRVTSAEPPPMELEPGGWIESQHDLSPANWYFSAERTGIMPYSVLLECALQPCGWLAAWLGSALRSEQKLQFRNLGGKAVIHAEVPPQDGLLRMRARLTSVSEAAAMIIEHFDFEVLLDDQPAYSGTTYFGFFTPRALARQKGIADANDRIRPAPEDACRNGDVADLPAVAPLTPQEAVPWKDDPTRLQLPSRALSMLDRIDCYLPAGGPRGLGYVRGVKNVNPEEWFFQAHFYQDPVWPGSLGIEAFMLLLKYAALQRWPQHAENHRFSLLTGHRHQWIYRGQVTPQARRVEVEAVITRVDEKPQPRMMASGFLKVDGLYIYEMQDFGISLAPAGKTAGIQGDNR
jgi:3-hydroxymyristoyl/3-hydroxydecanoyl-(acyl carrier protein) dehydratase